jgi:hypothetical protein
MTGPIDSHTRITFDSRKAKGEMHRRFIEILEASIRSWVEAAEAIIPVWTGESRATLVRLAAEVGIKISGLQPSATAPRDGTSDGYAKSTGKKTVVPGRYGFTYTSTVFQLIQNEQFPAPPYLKLIHPTPYNFRAQADAAFQKTWNSLVAKLNVNDIVFKHTKVRKK